MSGTTRVSRARILRHIPPGAVFVLASAILLGSAHAQVVTLTEALTRAVVNDPSLAASDARIEAANAGIRQAARKPNPSIGLELENFAGSGEASGFDQAETTVALQQILERGGKRQARIGVAQSQADADYFRREIRALDLFKTVEEVWVDALTAEAQLGLAKERLANATRFKSDIEQRVKAARDPSFADARANTQVAQARIAVDQARNASRSAREALAAFWRGGPDFELPLDAFTNVRIFEVSMPPAAAADLNLLEAERRAAAARLRLEKARTYQDPTLKVGVRHLAEIDDVALVAGVSIPLAFHDTNRDNVDRAVSEQLAANLDLEALQRVRSREVAQLRSRLAALRQEVLRVDADVLPEAERAVRLVVEGFNIGSFSYIDVIEAQRALADVRSQRIEALKAYHLHRAALSRLTGRHLNLIYVNRSR